MLVAEAFLRGGGSEALSLAGLGRHEEAIAIWDELLPLAEYAGLAQRHPNLVATKHGTDSLPVRCTALVSTKVTAPVAPSVML